MHGAVVGCCSVLSESENSPGQWSVSVCVE